VPMLPGGQQARALVTLEVKRSVLLPPQNTEIYKLPDAKRLPRDVRPFLGSSPLIESRNPRMKTLAKQIMGEKEGAWEKVESIYQWVRQKVKLKSGRLKGATLALKDGEGNHEDLASLFIALCRAGDIPARTVWVPKYCYPEFYLLDDEGKGHWFPCRVADNRDLGAESGPTSGKQEFGGISETGTILAKGDNFRSPHTPRERQRFPAESLTAESGNPKVETVRKLLP